MKKIAIFLFIVLFSIPAFSLTQNETETLMQICNKTNTSYEVLYNLFSSLENDTIANSVTINESMNATMNAIYSLNSSLYSLNSSLSDITQDYNAFKETINLSYDFISAMDKINRLNETIPDISKTIKLNEEIMFGYVNDTNKAIENLDNKTNAIQMLMNSNIAVLEKKINDSFYWSYVFIAIYPLMILGGFYLYQKRKMPLKTDMRVDYKLVALQGSKTPEEFRNKVKRIWNLKKIVNSMNLNEDLRNDLIRGIESGLIENEEDIKLAVGASSYEKTNKHSDKRRRKG